MCPTQSHTCTPPTQSASQLSSPDPRVHTCTLPIQQPHRCLLQTPEYTHGPRPPSSLTVAPHPPISLTDVCFRPQRTHMHPTQPAASQLHSAHPAASKMSASDPRVHTCTLPNHQLHSCVGGVHVCPLGTGPKNSEAAVRAGCTCVPWGLEYNCEPD